MNEKKKKKKKKNKKKRVLRPPGAWEAPGSAQKNEIELDFWSEVIWWKIFFNVKFLQGLQPLFPARIDVKNAQKWYLGVKRDAWELPLRGRVAQAKNAHTHGEPLVAHIGVRYKGVLHGYGHVWLARRAPWVRAVLPWTNQMFEITPTRDYIQALYHQRGINKREWQAWWAVALHERLWV